MTELLEPVESKSAEPSDELPVGHVRSPTPRVALCGAELLGIKAFGDFVVCEECQRLKQEWGFVWLDEDLPF